MLAPVERMIALRYLRSRRTEGFISVIAGFSLLGVCVAVATLIIVEPDAIVYTKMRTLDGPLDIAGGEAFGLGYFLLAVEQVLEDTPADWEAAMSITATIRYGPLPTLDELVTRVKILCTVYDPATGRYRTDWKLIAELIAGLGFFATVGGWLWRGRRGPTPPPAAS